MDLPMLPWPPEEELEFEWKQEETCVFFLKNQCQRTL